MSRLPTYRMFWITALQNERLIKPIACTTHEDLTKHDLQSLRRIALHTLRLKRNWKSDKPQIIGAIRTIRLDSPGLEILFQVPGTELAVFHCATRGTVELWHVGLGKMFGEPIQWSLQASKKFYMSREDDISGKFSLAFLTVKDTDTADSLHHIMIISVEYASGSPGIALKLSSTFDVFGESSPCAIFLNPELVGGLFYDIEDDNLRVIAMSRSTSKQVTIRIEVPSNETQIQVGLIGGGNLYILIVDTYKTWVFTIPHSHLPHDDNPSCPSTSNLELDRNVAVYERHPLNPRDWTQQFFWITTNATYGVTGMSLDTRDSRELSTPSTTVNVWVSSNSISEHGIPMAPLDLSMTIPGSLYSGTNEPAASWAPIVQTFSGRKALVLSNVFEELEETQILRLIACEPNSYGVEEIFYRDLILPDFIDLSEMSGLFLDDHLGVVSIHDSEGLLHIIPYA